MNLYSVDANMVIEAESEEEAIENMKISIESADFTVLCFQENIDD